MEQARHLDYSKRKMARISALVTAKGPDYQQNWSGWGLAGVIVAYFGGRCETGSAPDFAFPGGKQELNAIHLYGEHGQIRSSAGHDSDKALTANIHLLIYF